MNIFIITFFIFLCFTSFSEAFNRDNRQNARSHSLCIWNQTALWTHPYQSITVECCNEELASIIQKTIRDARNIAKLGNLAKTIQRRAQQQFHLTFETVVSKKNFAISSHYHGTHSCRIHESDYYCLIYETPVQYDPFNLNTENYLASIDSSDPLGSTKPDNLRGDFPDIREDPMAGEDLSVQPPIGRILQYPNKFALPSTEEDTWKKIVNEELRLQKLLKSEISMLNSGEDLNITDVGIKRAEWSNSSAAIIVDELLVKPVPRKRLNLRQKEYLPENTHCDKKRRDGNRCCDGKLASTMRDAMRQLATSPEFALAKEGIIAARIQEVVQHRFRRSYEVIVSRSDFAISTYMAGDTFCKFENRDFHILAYLTPRHYDIDNAEEEKEMSDTSNNDPLGSKETMLKNEASFHTDLELETTGDRAGYPVGSHCTEARTGSKCCSLILFNAMKSGYDSHISSFNIYDIRNISNAVQWSVEEVLQHSAEVIVALDDFTFATYNNNSYLCKYRVDKYYILAYSTPNHDLGYKDGSEPFENSNEQEGQIVYPVYDRTSIRFPVAFQNTPAPLLTTPVPNPTQIIQPLQSYEVSINNQPPKFFNQPPMLNQQSIYVPQPFIQQQIPYQQLPINPFSANGFHRSKRQIANSPYPIHSSVYNDVGYAKPFNCPPSLDVTAGWASCDGRIEYEAIKVLDETKQNPSFNKHYTRILAKNMNRAVEKRFGTTFETIVSESDFSWASNKYSGRTSKFDSELYSVLIFESRHSPPPLTDFIDIANDPTIGGPGPASIAATAGNGPAVGVAPGNAAPVANAPAPLAQANLAPVNFAPVNVAPVNVAPVNVAPVNFVPVNAPNVAPALAVGGGGGGGGACFSVDTWVTTPSGKKRMDEIDVGDYVLTANNKKPFFTMVTLWIHREPEKVQEFLTFITEYGKALRMTARHYMYRRKCGSSYPQYINVLPHDGEEVFASDVKVGDCVVVLYKGKYRLQKIESITKTVKTGIYSPLTSNGRIIVNDILASCYSEVHYKTLQTTFFWAYQTLKMKFVEWFGDMYHNKVELPATTSLIKQIISLIFPTKK